MENEHAIFALKRKRSELTGRINHLQDELRQAVIDLDHLDATLRLMCPGIDLETVKPKSFPPRHAAARGDVSRLIMDALRRSQEPMSARDFALLIMRHRGLPEDDLGVVALMTKRAGAALRYFKTRGLVRNIPRAGAPQVWALT